jgi:hypothetical protein
MKKFLLPFSLILTYLPVILFGQQFENGGFENWEAITSTLSEPVDWNTIKTADDAFIASVAPVTYDTSHDAHSGNLAIKIYNVKAFGVIATGAICNGRFHAEFDLSKAYSYTDSTDAQWHTPFTHRPDSLAGWFKYLPQEDDRAQFKVILHVGECKLPENGTFPNWVGMAVYNTAPGVNYETWTRFSVPFEYYQDILPRFFLCTINSGDSTDAAENSLLLVDDLEFIYGSSGIKEAEKNVQFLSVYPEHLLITLPENEYLGLMFTLMDMSGRPVIREKPTSNRIGFPAGLQPGVYIAVLNGNSGNYSQKIILR